MTTAWRLIDPGEGTSGLISHRLVTFEDCTRKYLAWLSDPK